MGKMIHEELSGAIVGSAMRVLNHLKPGLDEKLYERAMALELRHRGHNVVAQRSFPVSYRGELIGNLLPDLIVDDTIIVDSKVVSAFSETGADAWLLKHHRSPARVAPEFQERETQLEACCRTCRTRRLHSARFARRILFPSVKSA